MQLAAGIVPFLFAPLVLIVLMFLFSVARALAAEAVLRLSTALSPASLSI